jgi:putative aldouronate transport system substrate-binding protein
VTTGGRIAAMYGFQSVEGRTPKTGVVIRNDWLESLGLSTPVTVDDWHDVLTAFKDEKGAGCAYALPADGVTYPGLSTVYGPIDIYQVDGTVMSGITDTDAYRQTLALIHQWYTEGIISSDFMSDTTSKGSARPDSSRIASGEVGIWNAQASDLDGYADLITEAGADVVGLASAVLNEGDVIHTGTEADTATANMSISVSVDCQDPELVVRYFNYFFTEEGNLLANYGIEGETFEYVDGKPQLTELVTNNPDGMTFDQAQWLLVAGSTEGPYVFDYTKYETTYSERQLTAGEIWASNNDGAWDLPANVSSMLSADALSEYNQLMTDIDTYNEECAFKFILGDMDTETDWDTYVNNLTNTFNYTRVLELVQEGLTDYLG